jgi:hypothetical protein
MRGILQPFPSNTTRLITAGELERMPMSMRSSLEALRLLLLCACTSVALPAQQPPGSFTISGRVTDPLNLRPEGAVLMLGRREEYGSASASYVPLGADASFVTAPLPAGRYVLQIVRTPHSRMETVVGFKVVTVTTANVMNVVVAARRDTSLTGKFRMVTDNPGAGWPSAIVVNAPFAFEGEGYWPGDHVAEGASGGKFILRNAFGPRVLRCGYSLERGNSWWPDRVLLDGKDITNVPTDFSEHEGANLEVLFTQHPSRIRGTVVDAEGRPAGGAYVLVADADPTRRELWATTSRSLQADRDGSFGITTLPGKYVVQAFPPHTVSSQRNEGRLFARIASDAVRVALGDREQKTITLALPPQR